MRDSARGCRPACSPRRAAPSGASRAARLSSPSRRQRRFEDLADGLARIERGDRILEDILDHSASARGSRRARSPTSCPPLRIVPRGRPFEPDQHAGQGRLAGARFPDDAQGLAVSDVEGHVLTRLHLGQCGRTGAPPPKVWSRLVISISSGAAHRRPPSLRPRADGCSAPRGSRAIEVERDVALAAVGLRARAARRRRRSPPAGRRPPAAGPRWRRAAAPARRGSGTQAISCACRHAPAIASTCVVVPASTIRPAYITATLSQIAAHDAEIMGDEQDGRPAFLAAGIRAA